MTKHQRMQDIIDEAEQVHRKDRLITLLFAVAFLFVIGFIIYEFWKMVT